MIHGIDQRGSADEHLRMAVAAGHIGIWELDTVTGSAWRNATHDRIFGYTDMLDSWSYADFLDHVVAEDRTAVDDAYAAALANKEEWGFECRITRADGLVRWISANGKLLPGGDGKNERLIGHVIDITETRQREEHLRLVTEELNHRLKNIIASISGLIGIAAREEGDRREIAKVLQGRLAAIGRSHNLVFRDRSEAVALADVMKAELVASPDLAGQIEIAVDPKFRVDAFLAERLTLVLHELMTNAIKYGAMSTTSGTLRVESEQLADGKVQIRWLESGGPETLPPSREGFGSKLIRSSLSSDAKVTQEFPPEGTRCTITFPAGVVKSSA